MTRRHPLSPDQNLTEPGNCLLLTRTSAVPRTFAQPQPPLGSARPEKQAREPVVGGVRPRANDRPLFLVHPKARERPAVSSRLLQPLAHPGCTGQTLRISTRVQTRGRASHRPWPAVASLPLSITVPMLSILYPKVSILASRDAHGLETQPSRLSSIMVLPMLARLQYSSCTRVPSPRSVPYPDLHGLFIVSLAVTRVRIPLCLPSHRLVPKSGGITEQPDPEGLPHLKISRDRTPSPSTPRTAAEAKNSFQHLSPSPLMIGSPGRSGSKGRRPERPFATVAPTSFGAGMVKPGH